MVFYLSWIWLLGVADRVRDLDHVAGGGGGLEGAAADELGRAAGGLLLALGRHFGALGNRAGRLDLHGAGEAAEPLK